MDRVLGVLDGAVLVVSAVEGVQPQTRVLMRALRRLDVPTLLFINKVDRRGADIDRVVAEIGHRLRVAAVPTCRVDRAGTPDAAVVPLADDAFVEVAIDALAAQDDALLTAYVSDGGVPADRLRAALAERSRRGQVHPILAGSAATGAGVDALMAALVDLLPVAAVDDAAQVSGSVFAIERDPRGEKVAYARMFAGTLRTRDRPGHPDDAVTAIEVFTHGSWVRRGAVRAGEIGKLRGLARSRVGDPLGRPRAATERQFAPPGLEAVVEPVRPQDHVALRTALVRLAEQDPLIDVRDSASELAVSLYGEVQKEVLGATLAADHGVEVVFRQATPVCIERPIGVGEAVELLNTSANPFHATVGLRIEPAPAGSGVDVRVAVDHRDVPLYAYRRFSEFAAAMGQYVRRTLGEGRYGWSVSDCVVTVTDTGYSVADGPPSQRGPTSTAADFRKLTPMVVMAALDRADVAVCEPVSRVRIDAPAHALGALLAGLSRLGAEVRAPGGHGGEVTIEAVLPTTDVRHVHRTVPDLTGGEGVVEAEPAGYRPVRGAPPSRRRTTIDPRNRTEYLAALGAVVG